MTAIQPTLSVFRSDIFAGQTAIITGGGTGLGFGIAWALAAHGANVVLASRNIDRLQEAAGRIKEVGGKALAVQCDIRHMDQVENVIEQTEREFGRVNMFVANAGATFWARAEDLSLGGWRAVIDIDIHGTFHCLQAAGRRMIRDGGGSMICVTSVSPWTGNANRVHGGAGKAAVSSMVKSLAVEWGRYGIRINEIAPAIPTGGASSQLGGSGPAEEQPVDSEARAERLRAIPLGRQGRLTDIGNAAVFLLSDAASFITGTIMVVDGGSWLASRRSGRDDLYGNDLPESGLT